MFLKCSSSGVYFHGIFVNFFFWNLTVLITMICHMERLVNNDRIVVFRWTVPLRTISLVVIASYQTIQFLHWYERLKQCSHYSRRLISWRRDSIDRFCHSSSSRESVSLVISDFIKFWWPLIGCKAWVMGKSPECQGSEAHWEKQKSQL